jgi:branched-chain amino acid transport system substrate-binding protein
MGAIVTAGRMARRFAGALLGIWLAAAGLLFPGPAEADGVKLGLLFDVTGPVANIVPPLLDAARLAVDDVNANGGILNGQTLETVLGDTKGTAEGSIAAATKLVKSDKVVAIVGALMSLTTLSAADAVTIPNGVLLISPASTTPLLTTIQDNNFVFRVVPNDAYQGWVLGRLARRLGFTRVAVTYINNDYGIGISHTFRNAFEISGGTITAALAHEADKSSYLRELRQLTAYAPQALVVISFAGSGGATIIKQAVANGLFRQFIGTDSLMDPILFRDVGAEELKGMIFTAPTTDLSTSAAAKFEKIYSAAFETIQNKLFIAQTYDAVMLEALAIEQAGSTNRIKVRDALRQVCCAPGEVIEPGDWAKAKADIAAGKKINYAGASGNLDFDENGDVMGVYGRFVVENGAFKQVELIPAE